MKLLLRAVQFLGVLLACGGGLRAYGQVPGVTWAAGGDGTAHATFGRQAQSWGVVADAAGNTYVTGIFRDTLTLGGTRLVSAGDYDVYVARLDSLGRYQWAVQGGGNDWDISNAIGLDAAGNVCITGYVESHAARFGTLALASDSYGASLFVARLSPAGTWLQLASTSGPGDTYTIGTSLATDASGAVYVAGGLRGAVRFGATQVANYGLYGAFVAKLSAGGSWQWVASEAGSYDFANAVVADGAGGAYVTGSFISSTGRFGATTLTNAGYGGSGDVFVARVNAAGGWQWAVRGGSNLDDGGRGIAVAANGNVLVTGGVSSTAPRFGSVGLTKPDIDSDLFVGQLDTAGNWQWVTLAGGPGPDTGISLAVSGTGAITVAGTVGGPSVSFGSLPPLATAGKYDVAVAQLDATGSWRWALRLGGPGADYAEMLCAAPHGQVRLAGFFEGPSATFGSFVLPGGTPYYEYFADCQFVVSLADLALRSPAGLTLWPNPSRGTVWATGLTPGQPVQVYDTVGHLVVADARPTFEAQGLLLPPLAAGVYIVRSGSQTRKLVIAD